MFICIYVYIYSIHTCTLVHINTHTYMHVLQRVHANTSVFEASSTNVLSATLLLYCRRKVVDSIAMTPASITLQVASDYLTHNNSHSIIWVCLKMGHHKYQWSIAMFPLGIGPFESCEVANFVKTTLEEPSLRLRRVPAPFFG